LRSVAPDQLGVSELSRRLGHGKASTYRILTTLVEQGCLILNPLDKSYSLGPVLIALGDAASGGGDVLDAARSTLPGLAEQSNLTASAYRLLPDARLVAVASVSSSGLFQVMQPVGKTFPLVPPMGTLEYAFASASRLATMLASAEAQGFIKGDLDKEMLEEDIRWIRDRGYSWSISLGTNRDVGRTEVRSWLHQAEKFGVGRREPAARAYYLDQIGQYADREEGTSPPAPIFGLAAPVFDVQGNNILHLAVHGFLNQVPPERVSELGRLATATARRITAAIGGHQPSARELARLR
jgi:DNA-binding IclR family transcriptional regulator